MPGFDKTGPEGAGPRTGWGDGDCTTPADEVAVSDNNQPTVTRPIRRRFFSRRYPGRPFWRGRGGGGRGRGRRGGW